MKLLIIIAVIVCGSIGAWLGGLFDHGAVLGFWSFTLSTIGSLLGVWVGYRASQAWL